MMANWSGLLNKPIGWSARRTRCIISSTFVLVTLAYSGAIVLGYVPEGRRLDTSSVVLVMVAGAIALLVVDPSALEPLSSVAFGGFKAEFAQIRSRQEAQQRQVDSISAVLALLLTEDEQQYLLKLGQRKDVTLLASHDLRAGLRKLRGMRLLRMTKDEAGKDKVVAALTDGTNVNLTDFVVLTETRR